jgi:hypothetical protein
MGLKLLCAGCSKDERETAEAAVRKALGRRSEGGAWTVSLVRLTDRWSVTLDGSSYGVRALTLVAPEGRLYETIVGALEPQGAAPAVASAAAPARSAESRAPFQCEKCGGGFVLVYDAPADEEEETVPAACPHCWHVNRVLAASSAAETRDYRVEKA